MSGRSGDGFRLMRHTDPFESERAEAVDAVQRRDPVGSGEAREYLSMLPSQEDFQSRSKIISMLGVLASAAQAF
jgi:hypothetical protein